MGVNIGTVPTFRNPKADKEQAVKVLEEAAEVFAAWQYLDTSETFNEPKSYIELKKSKLTSECCDLIQATCNLLAGLSITDIEYAMGICKLLNEASGRQYEDATDSEADMSAKVSSRLEYMSEICTNDDDNGDFHCSKCGCFLIVADDYGQPNMTVDGKGAFPKYCPNCQRRIVER